MYLFVIGRILLGGYFMMSGYNHIKHREMMKGYAGSKGVPMPLVAVIVSGLMILLGGLGIFLGVYINISIALIAIFLVVVTFKMHQFWTITDPMQKMGEEVNFKKNLALLGAVLMFLAIPASTWALVALF
jgi:uncharacterized membrane protein YphA (DoxX/SURF4 family)